MIDGIYYAYATALFLLCAGYVLGYIVGRLDLIYGALRCAGLGGSDKPSTVSRDFFSQQAAAPKTKIEIDERKYVGAVKTDNLVKTSEAGIGKTTVAQDDIQASVSKLAQLKGK